MASYGLLSLFAIGCRNLERPGQVVTVRDSNGITVTTIEATVDEIPEWLLGEPVLKIDHPDEASATDFVEVADALWLSDGRILVVDAGAGRLLLFGSDGLHQASFGRQGPGPGEFTRLGVVSLTPGDTIFVYDPSRRTLQVFHPEAGFVRSTALPGPDDHATPFAVWALTSRRFVRRSHRYQETLVPSGPEWQRRKSKVVLDLLDEAGGRLAQVIEFDGHYTGIGPIGELRIPFSKAPPVFVGEPGILFGSSQSFHLIGLHPTTFARYLEVRWPSLHEPISGREIDRVRGQLLARNSSETAKRLADAALSGNLLPKSRPALGRAIMAPDGRIWAARFEPTVGFAHERLWYVLDAQGRPLGRLRLPENSHLTAVVGDQVLVVQRDSNDVASVVVYGLVIRTSTRTPARE